MAKAWPLSGFYRYESHRLSKFEKRALARFDYSTFVGRREAAHLPPSDRVRFIANGIDLEYFSPVPVPSFGAADIVFAGAMDYFPNMDGAVYFARQVFPRIRAKIPNARFLVVGSRPGAAVTRLAELPGVTVTGTVPDVRPYLSASKVAVVPLRISQGIQNKLLEALAVGLPVVTTPIVAEGFTDLDGLPVSVEREPGPFSERVIEALLRPPKSREEISAARSMLAKKYSWDANLSQFEELFLACVRRRAAASF